MNCQTGSKKVMGKLQSYGGKTKHQMKCRGTHSSGVTKREQQKLQAEELQAIATTQEKHPEDVTCHHCRTGPKPVRPIQSMIKQTQATVDPGHQKEARLRTSQARRMEAAPYL